MPDAPPPPKPDAPKKATNIRESVGEAPAWKKIAAILAIVVMAFGLGLQIYASTLTPDTPAEARVTTPDGTTTTVPNIPGVRGLAPIGPNGEPNPEFDPTLEPGTEIEAVEPEPEGLGVYSPAIFALGFSFFAGLAIAHALRTLMKATIIGCGFLILGLLGLEYAGFIDVQWAVIEERYEGFGSWATGQFASFQTFVTGRLPSIGAGAMGAVLGFKRK